MPTECSDRQMGRSATRVKVGQGTPAQVPGRLYVLYTNTNVMLEFCGSEYLQDCKHHTRMPIILSAAAQVHSSLPPIRADVGHQFQLSKSIHLCRFANSIQFANIVSF